MGALSENMTEELANVLDDKSAAMFVAGGRLFWLEVHDTHHPNEEPDSLAQEIEVYPELRESLQRFLDNTGMRRYTAKELKELRRDNRKFLVHFTEEFNKCLDQIQIFFAEHGEDVLEWWFSKEDDMFDEIDLLLSSFPYAGKIVDQPLCEKKIISSFVRIYV